jgi:hypothetical protein
MLFCVLVFETISIGNVQANPSVLMYNASEPLTIISFYVDRTAKAADRPSVNSQTFDLLANPPFLA